MAEADIPVIGIRIRNRACCGVYVAAAPRIYLTYSCRRGVKLHVSRRNSKNVVVQVRYRDGHIYNVNENWSEIIAIRFTHTHIHTYTLHTIERAYRRWGCGWLN